MKVAIIGSVGVPAKYGGFETLAEKLVEYLANKVELTVFCSGLQYTRRLEEYKGAKLEYVDLNANGILSIPYDMISIRKAARENDILLILGVAGIMVLPFVRLYSKSKVILHIDGMEWKRDKWKWFAKLFLKYAEKLGIIMADAIIADNEAILKNINSRCLNKTELISYGADHAIPKPLDKKLLKRLEIDTEKYSFSVCRIVPENNIKIILKAFRQTKQNLVFVGNWYDSNYGIDIWREYQDLENINLIHPIYNQEELDSLRSNCDFYIHGHSAGGTNPSLVEAMALNLKIVAFDVDFNRSTLDGSALFFKDTASLIKTIETGSYDASLSEHSILTVKQRYTWSGVTKQYLDLFHKLIPVEAKSND